MKTRITTSLDRDAVLNSLRELIEAHDGIVGVVNHNQVSLAYRSGILTPRLRVAAFLGRVVSARDGALIEGEVETHTVGRFVPAVLLFSSIASIGRAFLKQEYGVLAAVLFVGAAMLMGWSMYVRSTKKLIVEEICRASRGSVA